jgi:hypothetical protein
MARAVAMDKRERQSCAISKRPITRERNVRAKEERGGGEKKERWHEKIGTATGRRRDGEG